MTQDPRYDLIFAALARLRTAPAVVALIGDKLFDRVPEPDPEMPYVTLGPSTVLPADADGIPGVEVSFQLDIWSEGAGEAFSSVECGKIADAIRRALHQAELELGGNALVTLEHRLTQLLRDPDGITQHGVVQFEAVVETP
jgi:hypothetical protein